MIRLYLIGGLAAALIAAGVAGAMWLRTDARQDVISEIEERNNEAAKAANVADFGLGECLRADGVFWDFAAGVCRRVAADGGR